MNPQEIQSTIQELKDKIDFLEKERSDLSEKLDKLERSFKVHNHTDSDGTEKLRRGMEVIADSGSIAYLGNGGMLELTSIDSVGVELSTLYMAVGKDKGLSSGDAVRSINTQTALQTNYTDHFYFSSGNPQYQNSRKTVTLGGSTLTDTSFNWTTNELAGAYVNIYNSSGTFIETKPIASNTSSVITITGTWGATTTLGSYAVFKPTYLGSADFPWRRVYTGEGTGEGIRFGYGPTNGGQNGLIYMDATGNLYWRNKAGGSSILNASAVGASGFFTTVDGKTVTVTSGIVTSIV